MRLVHRLPCGVSYVMMMHAAIWIENWLVADSLTDGQTDKCWAIAILHYAYVSHSKKFINKNWR